MEIRGHQTSFEAGAMRDAIRGLLKQDRRNILLNLCGLQYLDSSGIGELVRNYVAVIKSGGVMKVVGLAPKVEEILKVTQLYQVFQEFPDEQAALNSFPANRPGKLSEQLAIICAQKERSSQSVTLTASRGVFLKWYC